MTTPLLLLTAGLVIAAIGVCLQFGFGYGLIFTGAATVGVASRWEYET